MFYSVDEHILLFRLLGFARFPWCDFQWCSIGFPCTRAGFTLQALAKCG
jgi:hypothetical protein